MQNSSYQINTHEYAKKHPSGHVELMDESQINRSTQERTHMEGDDHALQQIIGGKAIQKRALISRDQVKSDQPCIDQHQITIVLEEDDSKSDIGETAAKGKDSTYNEKDEEIILFVESKYCTVCHIEQVSTLKELTFVAFTL